MKFYDFYLQSGVNGSTSSFPDATGRAYTAAFSAQLGSSAADMNHTDAIGALNFPYLFYFQIWYFFTLTL